jgi:transcriptional regulator with XRE-family HTH domain
MERTDIANNFSKRLKSLLQKTHTSHRTNIDINQLGKIAGVSYQMARKYILGLALPEYHVIIRMSQWLNVSPGWLLFGEQENLLNNKSDTLIQIESELLTYILKKFITLFPPTAEADQIINFIVGVIYDATHINADNKTIRKIIDMMSSSAIQMREFKRA